MKRIGAILANCGGVGLEPVARLTSLLELPPDFAGMWTSRVTSHVPRERVAPLITRESVGAAIDRLPAALERAGGRPPRLAIAALDPHAGEGGAVGAEGIEILRPAIADGARRRRHVAGTFPADSVFPSAMGDAFNGVVTMYHDQGQIALKLIGLGKGVTLLAGCPVLIATPGHGKAFDIVGKGVARASGLLVATRLVREMAQTS